MPQIYLHVIRACDLRGVDLGGQSDPYIKITADYATGLKLRTQVLKKNRNPVYHCEYVINLRDSAQIHFKVLDWNKVLKHQTIGKASLKVSTVLEGDGGCYVLNLAGGGKGTLEVFARAFTYPTPFDPKLQRYSEPGSASLSIELPPMRMILEKDSFRPGEVIRGSLIWKNVESVKFKEIFLHLTCKVSTKSNSLMLEKSEPSFSNQWLILNEAGRIFGQSPHGGDEDSIHTRPRKLKKGRIYVWAFEFKLPPRLPPSVGQVEQFTCQYSIRSVGLLEDSTIDKFKPSIEYSKSRHDFSYLKEFYVTPSLESFKKPLPTPSQLDIRAADLPESEGPYDWINHNEKFQVNWSIVETKPQDESTPEKPTIMMIDKSAKIKIDITPLPGALAPLTILEDFLLSTINHVVLSYRQPVTTTGPSDGPNWKFIPLHIEAQSTLAAYRQTINSEDLKPISTIEDFKHYYWSCGPTGSASIPSTPPDFFPEMIESYHYMELSAVCTHIEGTQKPYRVVLGRIPISLVHERFLRNSGPVAPPSPHLETAKFRIIEVTDNMIDKVSFIAPDRLREPYQVEEKTLEKEDWFVPAGTYSIGKALASEVFMKEPAISPMEWVIPEGWKVYDWPQVSRDFLRNPSFLVRHAHFQGAESIYRPHKCRQ